MQYPPHLYTTPQGTMKTGEGPSRWTGIGIFVTIDAAGIVFKCLTKLVGIGHLLLETRCSTDLLLKDSDTASYLYLRILVFRLLAEAVDGGLVAPMNGQRCRKSFRMFESLVSNHESSEPWN
ncbi:uncharacterized protein N7446_010506 [Penicillium canescens]|uniref:Uncharacterized protein n=1 Tax=Penicillium canescens TaxID=5083 RepID=A0AAD6IBR2_PENCN|nr:uncharacterized protein N7446_010506 [Penicillium canescens]KAJ6041614.1 hypothetical protein N7460_007004 [Penicillium canescens]KAJ6050397.1 hypothetical protein N7446_010506 [Penicillium canescens]KAJ6064697.1 hypothetical protein N7444_000350 [Penicillium canescens]